MRKILLGLLLAALLPAASQAATCTAPAGTTLWSAIGTTVPATNWSCGGGAAGDTYVIPTGAEVVVTGDVLVTTGNISVTGGTLRVSPGVRLQPGASLVQTGGTVQAVGAVLYEGRLSAITWGNYATGATITLPTDVHSIVSTSTDYVVYGDDEPPTAGQDITGAVQIGPGSPTPGVFRPSYNEWAWYRITGSSASAPGATVTYLYDQGNQTGYTISGTPYAGQRGPGATGATVTAASVTRGWLGHFTDIGVTETCGADGTASATNPVTTVGDLGSQYVEVLTPSACAGRMAKILHTTTGACAGTDHLIVAGDLTSALPGDATGTPCTPATFRINYGARPGDKVMIVRPAVIDGWNSSATSAYVALEAGTFQFDWTRFQRLKPVTATTFGSSGVADAAMNCAICVIQKDASTQPLAGSYMRNVEIAWTDHPVNTDEAALLWGGSSNNTYTSSRFGTMFDMNGITFERLYVHDALASQASNGIHIWNTSAKNATGAFKRLRCERVSDQCFSGWHSPLDTSDNPSFGLTEGLLWENLPGSGRSAQGIKWVCYDRSKAANCAAGASFVKDVITTGEADGTIASTDWSVTYNRVVAGGSAYGLVNVMGGYQPGAGTGTAPNSVDSTYPNLFLDSYIGYWNPTTTYLKAFEPNGDVLNSIVTGQLLAGDTTGHSIYQLRTMSGSIVNASGYLAAGNENMFWLQDQTGPNDIRSFTLQDTVINAAGASNAGKLLCNGYGGTVGGLTSFTLSHFFMLGAGSETSTGLLKNCGTNAGSSPAAYRVDNVIYSPATPAYGLGGPSYLGNGVSYTNVWMATVNAKNTLGVCGTSPSATCNVLGAVYPTNAWDGKLRQFIGRPDSPSAYARAKPFTLGWQTLGPAHAMLGDFVLGHLEDFSSRDLAIPVTSGWAPTRF